MSCVVARVDPLGQLEDNRDTVGRIEIFVHSGGELVQKGLKLSRICLTSERLLIGILQILKIGRCIMNSFFREIDRLTIMLGSKEETQHLTINGLEGIMNGDKIT